MSLGRYQLRNIMRLVKKTRKKTKSKKELPFKYILRELLDQKEFSQRKFAKSIGVAPSTLDSWLAGSVPTDLFAIKKAAEIFGVSVSYLIYGVNDEIKKPITVDELFTSEKLVQGYFKVSIEKLTTKPN